MANFQFISKNNIGGALALFLVILLSQARIFNILLDTVLGRMLLIAFLLIISYLNKILGVVSVLIIIIMFNNSDIGFMEGFTTDISNNKTANNIKTDISNNELPASSEKLPEKPEIVLPSEKPSDTSSSSIISKTKTSEGFDIIGKESNIKRGKQSNSIPVNDFMRESTHVSPHEGFSKLESFSSF
jgi:hypothetical protein